MKLVPINKLKPIEKVFPNHLTNLSQMIKASGYVKSPIIIDKNTYIILDGSHRYVFLLIEGYTLAPVHYVDYNDENIRVGTHLMHRHIIEGSIGISKKEVIKRGLSGDIYPPRTTRHFFPFRKNVNADIKLTDLKKDKPVDVSNYIANVSLDHEVKHNIKFIEELEIELDELIKYMDEIRLTKKYLKEQNQLMDSK